MSYADGYVFPDQAVQKNKEIQDILKNKLKEGKKIYIYSDGLSIKEFEELIGIENAISPPENTEELKKNSTPTPRYYVASDDQFNVIGYANSNNKFPIYLATYVNQDNIPLLADDYMHLRAIIDHNMKVQSNSSDHSTTNNSAIASSPTIVASQPDISKYVYFEVSGQPRVYCIIKVPNIAA